MSCATLTALHTLLYKNIVSRSAASIVVSFLLLTIVMTRIRKAVAGLRQAG